MQLSLTDWINQNNGLTELEQCEAKLRSILDAYPFTASFKCDCLYYFQRLGKKPNVTAKQTLETTLIVFNLENL